MGEQKVTTTISFIRVRDIFSYHQFVNFYKQSTTTAREESHFDGVVFGEGRYVKYYMYPLQSLVKKIIAISNK